MPANVNKTNFERVAQNVREQRVKMNAEREFSGELAIFKRQKLKELQKNNRDHMILDVFNSIFFKMQKVMSTWRKASARSAQNRARSSSFWGCLPIFSSQNSKKDKKLIENISR